MGPWGRARWIGVAAAAAAACLTTMSRDAAATNVPCSRALLQVKQAGLEDTESAWMTEHPGNDGLCAILLGTLAYVEGRSDESEGFYREALRCFEGNREPVGQGIARRHLGDLAARRGRDTEAEGLYRDALVFLANARTPIGQGNAWTGLGNLASRQGRNDEALAMYRKALTLFEAAQAPIGQGNARSGLGVLAARQGRFDEAEGFYGSALSFYEQAQAGIGQGLAWKGRGDIAYLQGKDEEADALYRRALPFFERVRDPVGQGNVWRSLGDLAYLEGRNAEAETRYRKALALFEKSQEFIGQRRTWTGLGDLATSQGRNTEAEEHYRKAVAFFEEAREPLLQGRGWAGLGNVAYARGRNAEAERLHRKALLFYEQAQSPLGQGNAWSNLGNLASRQNRYAEAEGCYRKALRFFERAREPLGQGNIWHDLGLLAFLQGRMADAEEFHRRALPFFEGTREPRGQGNAWVSLGELAFSRGQAAEAERLFRKALAFYEQAQTPVGQGAVWLSLGRLQADAGHPEEALSFVSKALAFHSVADASEELREDRYFQGQVLERLNRIPEALEAFEAAADLAGQLVDQSAGDLQERARYRGSMHPFFEAPVRLRLRLHQGSRGSGADPEAHARAAFATLEQGRSQGMLQRLRELGVDLAGRLLPEGLRQEEEEREVRIRDLRTLARAAGPDSAMAAKDLETLEKEREAFAATLWENPRFMAYASLRYPRKVDPVRLALDPGEVLVEFLAGEKDVYRWVVFRGSVLAFDRLPWAPNDLAALVRNVRQHSGAGEVALPPARGVGLARAAPEPPSTVPAERVLYDALVADARSRVPKGGRLVLSPDGPLLALPFEALVDAEGQALGLAGPVLYTPSARSLELQRRQARTGEAPNRTLLALGDPVYNRKSDPRCGGPPDGCGEPRGAALQVVRKACQALDSTGHGSRSAAARAAAAEPATRMDARSPTPARELTLRAGVGTRLCATRGEVARVVAALDPRRSDIVLDLDARKSRLMALLGQHGYRVLHLSTHGLLPDAPLCADEGHPCIDQPALVLADAGGSFDDRFLTAGEVLEFFTSPEYRARRLAPPALVTLSACRTAEGEVIRGEGVQGMGQAFLYAGARNVVMSLWSVDDESAAAFMETFYRAVQAGHDPATAAWEARRALHDLGVRRRNGWDRPFHWAPFIVTGMGETE